MGGKIATSPFCTSFYPPLSFFARFFILKTAHHAHHEEKSLGGGRMRFWKTAA